MGGVLRCRECGKELKSNAHLRMGDVPLEGSTGICVPCADRLKAEYHVRTDGEFIAAYVAKHQRPGNQTAKLRNEVAELRAALEAQAARAARYEELLEGMTAPESAADAATRPTVNGVARPGPAPSRRR